MLNWALTLAGAGEQATGDRGCRQDWDGVRRTKLRSASNAHPQDFR